MSDSVFADQVNLTWPLSSIFDEFFTMDIGVLVFFELEMLVIVAVPNSKFSFLSKIISPIIVRFVVPQ
jgi:hypothetical protein